MRLCCFHPDCTRRYLHSFPTRRSSDLTAPSSTPTAGLTSIQATASIPTAKCSAGPSAQPPARSEEHTSELQSRGHLVCRLLLEKKKKTNIQTETNYSDTRTKTP